MKWARSGPLAGHVAVVVVALSVAGSLGWAALELRIRVHDLELMPASSAVLAIDEERRRRFGSDERFVIGLTSRQRPVTDPEFAAVHRGFVERLIESRNTGMLLLDRLYRPRFAAGWGEPPRAGPWLLEPPGGEWIEAALDGTATVPKLAVSHSGRVAFLETAALSTAGVSLTAERVDAAFEALDPELRAGHEVRFVGRHVVLDGLGEAILADIGRLLPWTFAIVFCLMLALFRSPTLAALALVEVGLAVASTMGALRLLGHELSLMTALVPILVTVLGVADEIHLFGEFLRLRAESPERPAAAHAWGAARRVLFPVTATTLTTGIGFTSFFATDVPALRVFGLLAGIGVCVSWLLTLTFVPAVLALLPVGRGPRWVLAASVERNWSPARLGLAIIVTLLLVPGVLRLRIDDGWTRNFAADHPIVEDVRWFERESVGLYQFDLVLDRLTGPAWASPEGLRRLDELRRRVEALPEVTAAFTLADLVRDRAWELGGQPTVRPPVPDSQAEVLRLLHSFRVFNEEVFVRSFLATDGHGARLIAFSAGDDYEVTRRARSALDRLVEEELAGSAEVQVGGSAERGRVLIESVVTTQARAVGVSLLVVWVALGLASGRWLLALRCVASIAWALALVLGVVGWAGVPLGVASSSFLSIGLGIGLDYAIHLAFAGGGAQRAVVRARVLANVLAVGAGLSVLILSANPTVARFGGLVVLSMLAAGYTGLVVFPRRAGAVPTAAGYKP